MKILLISIGTRGDIEPFLAVGQLLLKNGHEVHTAFPAQYAYLAEESGLECFPLCKEFIELIEGPEAKMLMGGGLSLLKKIKGYYRMYKESTSVNRKIFVEQHDLIEEISPDRVVYSGKAVYPIAWSKENLDKTILLSPVPCLIHEVKHLPHLGFHNDMGVFNSLTYKLANYGLVSAIKSVSKVLESTKGLTKKAITRLIKQNKIIYAISPQLFPRPNYWPDHASIQGYQERDKIQNWRPKEAIQQFISRHQRVLFVTFGSMTNPKPDEKTQLILSLLSELRIPAVINCAEGGLTQPESYDQDQFHFVNRIPYDWILPQVYAIMHHGGSGTTHLGVKYGCASLIIPHIIDQYLWNNIICEKKLGPKGVSIHKMNRKKMRACLEDLWFNERYRTNAQEVGRAMRKEDYSDKVLKIIVGN